ncbi:ABC-F family ATP-binding cassette domain-containing protein [Chloroflexota bacterium]
MLNISNISKSYSSRELFSGVSFTIGMSDRIAVIGPNGTGKTTLFEIITGNIMPDSGNVTLRRGTTIGYLRQNIRTLSKSTLLEEVSRSSDTMNNLAHKIHLLQEDLADEKDRETIDTMLEELGELQGLYESKGGYDSEHEAKIILSGLGFIKSDFRRALSEFSGGWQTRIELAKLLFLNPDILVLDEPTNHLDLETQRWFENYLKRYHGAILVTSHDRAFLNNVVRKIISIEADDVIFYHGDYDSYVQARQKDMETRQAAARRQEVKISREMRFIERFRAKATKATQVQSRIKKLEKIERISVPRSTKKIHFNFSEPSRSGQTVIELKQVAKSYDEHVVYQELNLALERGDRAAIVGVNGAGKTTLLRMLAGVLPFENGKRILGHNVTTAYFAQHYIESLNPHNSIIEELQSVAPNEPEQYLRSLLGAFLFSGDDVTKKIAVLSGGEKTKVAIARMLTKPANFLLLDEPTNHLDIPSREILADALDAYKGTICLITHDRTLIREIANKIIEARDGKITVFRGDYDDYLLQSEVSYPETSVIKTPGDLRRPDYSPGSLKNRNRKVYEGRLRNEHYRAISPVNKRITEIEQEVTSGTERIKEMEAMIADPEHYKNAENVMAVNREYVALRERIQQLTGEWDILTAEAERLKQEYRLAQENLEKELSGEEC